MTTNRYAKMQHHSLSEPEDGLLFDRIVPNDTSTRHVAAAAFYHCLGKISTFDRLRVRVFPHFTS